MKYHLSCTQCRNEKKPTGMFAFNVVSSNIGIYDITCPEGHSFKVDVMTHKFQLLFENGIQSIVNKYYIEAFVSFVTSYERFIEYFLRTVSISNSLPIEEFENAWKALSKQSERQLGAFILVYLHEFKTNPNLLSNSNITLRNSVIHKGYLPTYKIV